MIKTASAIAIAAITAACFVALPSLSEPIDARSPVVGAKGDRADMRPLGIDCGEKAPPAYATRALPLLDRVRFEPFWWTTFSSKYSLSIYSLSIAA